MIHSKSVHVDEVFLAGCALVRAQVAFAKHGVVLFLSCGLLAVLYSHDVFHAFRDPLKALVCVILVRKLAK